MKNHETRHGRETTAGMPGTVSSPTEPNIRKPEVARRLLKTVRTVDNYMRSGFIPYHKIGKLVFFKWSEIDAACIVRVEARTNCETREKGKNNSPKKDT